MRQSAAYLLAAFLLTGASSAGLVDKRQGSGPAVVQLGIQGSRSSTRLTSKNWQQSRRHRRADTLNVVATNNDQNSYYVNLTVGTPPQAVSVDLDTGSSDLWFNVPTSLICSEDDSEFDSGTDEPPCSAFGTYSPNSSSTYNYLNSQFSIVYGDNDNEAGDYATDTVVFGESSLDNMQFGIAYSSNTTQGILGIGLASEEASLVESGAGGKYYNLPQRLVQAGAINTNAYSLWLDDLDASTGSILFGGVNTAKYTGDLSSLPIVQEAGSYLRLTVGLSGIGIGGQPGSVASDLGLEALLDSGTTLIYLPLDVVQPIYKQFNVRRDGDDYIIKCSQGQQSQSVQFTFTTATINVSISELVLQVSPDDEYCIFGIYPQSEDTGTLALLGDTFLRSAYVVYDLDNLRIAIAQTDFESTTDNIVEIQSGSSIPGATSVSNALSYVAAATESQPPIGLGTATRTASSRAGAMTQAPKMVLPGLSGAALAAAGAVAMIL